MIDEKVITSLQLALAEKIDSSMRLSCPFFLLNNFLLSILVFDTCRSLRTPSLAGRVLNFDWNNKNFPQALISGPRVTRKEKKKFKLLFLLGLLSIETLEEIYVRVPQQMVYGSSPRELLPNEFLAGEDENLAIIFPGAGGPDRFTDELKGSILDADRKAGVKRKVVIYDWSSWRGPFIRAAFDGQLVGKTVGTQIALEDVEYKQDFKRKSVNSNNFLDKSSNIDNSFATPIAKGMGGLRNIDFIGISVGAFAADSAAKWYHHETIEKIDNKGLPFVHTKLTLLDPFTSKGIFGYHWGIRNFGMTLDSNKVLNLRVVNDPATDYFEVYLNTDDPVPSTGDPILNANNFDVTDDKSKMNFKPPQGESMHSWPVVYLAQNWITKVDGAHTNAPLLSSRALTARGSVEKF